MISSTKHIILVFALLIQLTIADYPQYRVIGLDDQGNIVNDCSFPCYEANCSETAIEAYHCPNATWIAFVPSDIECQFFSDRKYDLVNYTVFAVDSDRYIIPDSMQYIPNYFVSAVNYGCALVQLWPDAVWFGMNLYLDRTGTTIY